MTPASILLPYLLLVTFMSGSITEFNAEKIQAINASPYQGVAVPMIDAYDAGSIAVHDFPAAIKRIKEHSRKHVWPWVFINRMVGFEDRQRAHSPSADKPYFRNIQGMALDEGSQPLRDFYQIWRLALSSAKEMGTPGIVVDLEPYNHHLANRMAYVMSKTNMNKPELIARFKQIGAHLCDAADEIYPGAVIWFLYTGVVSQVRGEGFFEREYRPDTYIVFGMLEHAAKKNSRLILVSGGEVSLGYCNKDLQDLKTRITRRNQQFEPLLTQYLQLKLGGTIAPWHDRSIRKGWMLKKEYAACANSTLDTAASFRPLLKELLASYSYVWVYAAGAARYNPYDKPTAEVYNKAFAGLP